jgi:hypothetical protein
MCGHSGVLYCMQCRFFCVLDAPRAPLELTPPPAQRAAMKKLRIVRLGFGTSR